MKLIVPCGTGASSIRGSPLSREKKSSTWSKGASLKLNLIPCGAFGAAGCALGAGAGAAGLISAGAVAGGWPDGGAGVAAGSCAKTDTGQPAAAAKDAATRSRDVLFVFIAGAPCTFQSGIWAGFHRHAECNASTRCQPT